MQEQQTVLETKACMLKGTELEQELFITGS